MAPASGHPTPPTPARRARRFALGAALFLVAGYVSGGAVIDNGSVNLAWPAAGVAAIWIASGNRATWALDAVALGGATLLVQTLAGAPLNLTLVFILTNFVQIAAFVFLARWSLPHIWGLGGSRALADLSDLGRLAAAGGLAAFVGVLTGAVAATIAVGEFAPEHLSIWWGRNTIVLVIAAVLATLVGRSLAASGSGPGALLMIRRALTPPTALRAAETAGLVVATAGLVSSLFLIPQASPLAFLLLVLSVWAGLRFSPVTITLHGVAMGASGLAFTLNGQGPFALVESAAYRAGIAQAFVVVSVFTGLALAFGRAQRDTAHRALAAARQAADERAQLLDAVLESLHEGLVVVEEGGHVLIRNPASKELLGLAGDDVTAEPEPDHRYGLFRPNGEPLADADLPANRALNGESVQAEDFHVRSPAIPHGRVLEISAEPLENQAGAPRRALVNIRDVTIDRQHRDTLASFAGVVAHDLFNPLTVVSGWADALIEEFDTGPVAASTGTIMAQRISGAAAHMRAFISDLMSYTIARDQSLQLQSVDLTDLVRHLAQLRTDLRPTPTIRVDEGLLAWADTGMVRQLLDNLIGNAIKYVPPGVSPQISVTGTSVGEWIEIRVADNGIGIPDEEREAVFDSFYRASGTNVDGTGLGLAICRRIVERHGGELRVESGTDGFGSAFIFLLPRLPAPSGGPTRTNTDHERRLARQL